MRLRTTWKLIGGEVITAGIYRGDILIGKVVRMVCPSTGAVSFALQTMDAVRHFQELPAALRAIGVDGPWQRQHAAITEAA